MGFEPEEKEIPMEIDELSLSAQYAILLFHVLPDKISDMGGIWLGKDYAGLMDIMEIYQITNKRDTFDLLQICCNEYESYYEEQRKIREKIPK